MKQKTNVTLLFLATIFLLSVMTVSAAVGFSSDNITIVTPTAGSILTGTLYSNVTIKGGYQDENYTTSFVYLKSASTANSSWSLINGSVNTEATNISDFQFNISYDSADVEDSNDYTFNVTIWNGSDYRSKTVTVTTNNTVPTTPTSLAPTATITNGSFTISSSVTGSRTTGCTLYFDGMNPGSTNYTMTHSGNTCTQALTLVPEQTYNYYVIASDNSETATSSTSTVTVDETSGGGEGYYPETPGYESVTETLEKESQIPWTGIIIVIIVILVIIIIAKRK